MKYFKLILSLVLTIGIFFALNTKFGSIPPIGKFLNPYSGVWQNETDESISGDISLPELIDKVTVHYDAQLIPHVFAQNETDLYRAQGYLTAKHRLWQMEFQTYAAAGRLSEIIGEGALNYDRQERRRGMMYGAEQALLKMEEDEQTTTYIKAYSEGVNSYINQLKEENLPVEYKLLDYKPEEWTPKKTALLLMYMTKMLAGGDEDIENTNALRLFGKERFDLLFPDFFDITDPIIPKETDWSFIDVPQTPNPNSEPILDSIAETIDKPDPNYGSNNWAVSPQKSSTGNAILANDPHLGLNLPSIWFVMQLSTPNHNAFGATLPGALAVISGFNQHIAWGETNATRDVIDWYKIEFNEDGTKYKFDDTWKDVTYRIEEIKIKGKETYKDSIRFTHHGPVVFDKNFKSDNEKTGYAMKWIGHIGGNNQKTFLDLNKGKNYNDYVEAISNYTAPAQNFVFASTEGDIALWIQGKLPNKWEGQGKFIMDGSKSENDWQSFIPQKFNAHTKNPERGFVSSANQHPVDEAYPYFVFNDGYETYRNRVINDFFNSKDKFGIQDFKDLHNNNYNLKASELMPYMLKTMDISNLTAEEKELYDIAKAWQYNNDMNEIGPSIWRAWYGILYNMVWDEFDVEDTAIDAPFTYQTIYLLKTKGDDAFMDIIDTPEKETAKDLFKLSFSEAVVKLNDFKAKNGSLEWVNYKATYVGHLLQALPAFSRFDVPIGGGRNIVNATSENWGPSWRMIVEMTSPPTALGIYPGGQSGNPGSKYYDNFIDDWAAGKYHSLNFLQNDTATDAIIGTQTLTPSK
ncbi:penicillin acylase family protein [Winogradskyella echinorum]|uniref:Penicillin acylase family protein n=1 Tax=Winogradskyella echinorum TaxID=538189 RepID=A0ABR6Y2F9_9FLAO|nr:penicillin acylase family protein [Winogradskyella echinorum]MBC3846917.1 penicillin acylase family protein [Winogradskyella echinorum]MBC5751265.1 penicillin acylase family protein [Winogradskyella echinorum]